MTFNGKGFRPQWHRIARGTRNIKGFSPLSFIVIYCHCALPNHPNLLNFPKFSILRQPAEGKLMANSQQLTATVLRLIILQSPCLLCHLALQ